MVFEEFLQDIRIGFRVLTKEKFFCFLAGLVLAVGICAVTTQYAVVNGVLLHAFKFPGGDRLVGVSLVDPNSITPSGFNSRTTAADFVDLRAGTTSFDAFVGYLGNTTVTLTYEGNPQRLQGGYVPHDFFRVLGVSPTLGRDFTPEDDQPGATEAVMLNDAYWRSSFGTDPSIVGQTVRVNGRAGVVVGVMPPKFVFPTYEQVWIPFQSEFPVRPRNDRNTSTISIIARLKPGVSVEQAAADVSGMARQFARDYPDPNRAFTRGLVQPLIETFTGAQLPGLLYTLLGFCAGVLLIACVNVMNMQFARATLRSKELAIRSALGATRDRLIRQMLTESLLLATLGAIIGIALAFYATSYLNAAMTALTNPLPSWMSFTIDRRVLGFVVGVAVLAAVIAGFVPAWLASRARTAGVLKESGRGNTSRAVGIITRGLVVCQILVTSVLLIGALLQVQSIQRQQNVDYGYDTTAVLGARLGLMPADYPTPAKRQLFYENVLRALRAAPQFEAVALTNRNRMVTSGAVPIEIEGRDYKSDSDRRVAQYETVSSGYFDVLGTKLREGRDFTDLDTDQRQPVAIVNAAFARLLGLVLRQGAMQLGLGLTLGFSVVVAIVGASAMQGLLFGISPRDPLTYLAVALILSMVSLTATLIPACRATRVDPVIALRAE